MRTVNCFIVGRKVPVVDALSTSMSEVIGRYISAGVPVILRNSLASCFRNVSLSTKHDVSAWSALKLFDIDSLRKSELGSLKIESIVGLNKDDIKISDFINSYMNHTDESLSQRYGQVLILIEI